MARSRAARRRTFRRSSPAILAGLLLAFGDTLAFAYVAILLAAFAQAVHCVLSIPLSAEVFHDRRPGIAAAIFSAVVPAIAPLPQWEAIYAALAWMVYRKTRARQWAAFAPGAALMLLPWTVRNYTVIGGLFFVRDNLGSEVYMSNADCSDARHCCQRRDGLPRPPAAQ